MTTNFFHPSLLLLFLDPGSVKIRIRDKHPGSATLYIGNSYGTHTYGTKYKSSSERLEIIFVCKFQSSTWNRIRIPNTYPDPGGPLPQIRQEIGLSLQRLPPTFPRPAMKKLASQSDKNYRQSLLPFVHIRTRMSLAQQIQVQPVNRIDDQEIFLLPRKNDRDRRTGKPKKRFKQENLYKKRVTLGPSLLFCPGRYKFFQKYFSRPNIERSSSMSEQAISVFRYVTL